MAEPIDIEAEIARLERASLMHVVMDGEQRLCRLDVSVRAR
jgi:hypothetical protein